jgi:hypothetical protein
MPAWHLHLESPDPAFHYLPFHCPNPGACPRALLLQLLPAVVPMLVSLFERALLPACLDALGDIVEIHFQEGPATQEALASALGAACAAAFPRLQVGMRASAWDGLTREQ